MRYASVRLTSVVVVAGLLATGCKQESPRVKLERELVELRTERTEKLDGLYKTYGGGDLSGHVAKDARKEAKRLAAEANAKEDAPDATDRDQDGNRFASKMLGALGNVAEDMDRAGFDSHCETIGKGQRATILTTKARTFFSSEAAKKTCREIADLSLRIAERERQIVELGDNGEPAGK